MKKIKFYKSMRNGELEQSEGYLYQAQNGVRVAIHGGSKNGGYWNATELTTGLSCSIATKTLAKATEKVEQMAGAILHFFESVDCSKYANRIAEQKGGVAL